MPDSDIIAKLETAEAGSRELDALVAETAGWGDQDETGGWHQTGVFFDDGKLRRTVYEVELPHFSTSVDAALTLVPEGHWLQHLGQTLIGWRCLIEKEGQSFVVKTSTTAALALCIACFKARARLAP